jgi:hypothetical protein
MTVGEHSCTRRALLGVAAGLQVVERGTKGLSFEAAEAVQEAYDARCDAWEAAIGRAFAVPAPDVGAFAAKVVWAVDLGVAEFGEGEAMMAALRADAVRVLGVVLS